MTVPRPDKEVRDFQQDLRACTVLAASLACQFGLESGAVRSRSFRFVVNDEAFGRGSDEPERAR